MAVLTWKTSWKNSCSMRRNKPECDAILVLLDADDDCPVDVSRHLSQRCEQSHSRCPVQVVYAHREYESWFLASLDTIKGRSVIPDTASFSAAVEDISNPKQWLTDQMSPGRAYKETTHQTSFTKLIDIELAFQKSRSFRRLCHALEQLLDGISNHPLLNCAAPSQLRPGARVSTQRPDPERITGSLPAACLTRFASPRTGLGSKIGLAVPARWGLTREERGCLSNGKN